MRLRPAGVLLGGSDNLSAVRYWDYLGKVFQSSGHVLFNFCHTLCFTALGAS